MTYVSVSHQYEVSCKCVTYVGEWLNKMCSVHFPVDLNLAKDIVAL